MKRFFLFFFGILSATLAFSQVTIDPTCFGDEDEITIVYDATQGSSGLVGASKVYMHAGVITDSPTGSSWKHVVGDWGQDNGIGEMTKVSGESNKWEITLTPRTYFDVPASETIYRLGMVFRNEDGSKEGKTDANGDIFVTLSEYASSLQVTSALPALVDNGETITIEAFTCSNADFTLFVDNVEETQVLGSTTFSYNYQVVQSAGSVISFRLEADIDGDLATKEFSVSVRTPTVSESRPAGIIDGINYGADPSKVTLSLLAPLKSSVYVIGDFNDWAADPNYQMKKDGEHFWVEISGLTPGQEYVFQYLVDETIRVADPFTDKVSDPWDDKYIDNATYPNLIQYPDGKTTNRASVLQTNQQAYAWTNTSFTPVAKEDLVIYELLVRDFDERHSYKAVLERLDYIESLGVNAIEFMPTNEFEGNSSWGYNPSFYFAPDKYYGPKNDFKALIDECHNRGIAVIIDLVLNHSYGSSPMVRMYWNSSQNRPSADNPWYNEQSNFENPDAQWGYDFNHESQYTKDFVDSVNTYWMEEYKVDGFRFDFTKGFSNNFKSNTSDSWGSLYDANRIANLKRMADAIWSENPDAYVIFEHLSDNNEETVLANYGIMLWGNMNYDYNEMSMGYASGKSIKWGYYTTRGWSNNSLVSYMESHDEERQMYKNITWGNSSGDHDAKVLSTALQRSRAATSFFLTVPGPKMIWMFGEYGYDISIDENGRVGEKPVKWEYLDNQNRLRLFDTYKELIKLRKTYGVFTNGSFSWQPDGNSKSIHIANADTSVVILGNFDVEPMDMDPEFQHTGSWYDFFSGKEIEVSDVNASIALGPGEFRIYSDHMLHTPDIVLGLEKKNLDLNIDIYPNPVSKVLNIYVPERIIGAGKWSIVDTFGRVVLDGDAEELYQPIEVSQLPVGIYSMVVETKEYKMPIKFIKQ